MSTQDVTITVQDAADDPVEDVSIEIRHTQGGGLVGTLRTDSDGEAVLADLTNGSYLLTFRKQGFRLADQGMVVADTGVDQLFTYEGVVLAIATPTPRGMCRLFGFVEHPEGTPWLEVYLGIDVPVPLPGNGTGVNPLHLTAGGVHDRVIRTYEGRWEVDIPQGSTVTVFIPHASGDRDRMRTVVLPYETQAAYADLHSVPVSSSYPTASSSSSS